MNGAVVDGLEQIPDLDLVLNGTPLEVKCSGYRVQFWECSALDGEPPKVSGPRFMCRMVFIS